MPAIRDWSKMGSSYITALLGDPDAFLTPIEVWCKMTKQEHLLPNRGGELNQLLYWGSKLEDLIIDSFEEDYQRTFTRNLTLHSSDFFCDTPDGLDFNNPTCLETKNVRSNMAWKWEDFVPKYVFGQCQWHIKHFDAELIRRGLAPVGRCYVRALIGGCEKIDRVIERDDKFINDMEVIGQSFIDDYVIPKIPPPVDCTKAYGEFLFSKYPEVTQGEKSFIEINADDNAEAVQACADLIALTNRAKSVESEIELRKNILKEVIGANYGLISEYGKIIWNDVAGRVSHSKALEKYMAAHPRFAKGIMALLEETRGKSSRQFRTYFK